MSTAKIKTEPTTTAATAAAVDVKVKLEQRTSDIDTKVEPDSEDYIKSEEDDDDNGDQDQFTIAPKKRRQFTCDNPGCGLSYYSSGHLNRHQHEHKLQVELSIHGKSYILTRQLLDDRWSCPVQDCNVRYKNAGTVYSHIRTSHGSTIGQHKQQQSSEQTTRNNLYFLNVDDFYVNGVRCGYHSTIRVFICHECKLVPECLLTHLQQKHGYDEKSIDKSALPENAVTTNTDPNGNQHTNNTQLASAIREPDQQQHRDIVQGWLCVTADCGYCCSTKRTRNQHKYTLHQGEQFLIVQALVLRLAYTKTYTSCFLITRIDQVTKSSRVNQHKLGSNHNGLDAKDENGDEINQNESTETSNQKRQRKCDYPDCGLFFNSAEQLSSHRREHKLEVEITVRGKPFTLTRQSPNDRWACPVPECETTCKSVAATRLHIHVAHDMLIKQKRAKTEDDDNQQQQITKKKQRIFQYLKVDDFRVNGVRCGYHTTTGVFICHECKLVPECLLTHLQQMHEYDEKSIETAILPESAVNASVDPNNNQLTDNPHLASAIREPSQLHHPDIVQGWLCVTSNCGHCGYSIGTKSDHKKYRHKGEQISTVPAQLLRLLYAKAQNSYFLITRLDTASNNIVEPTNLTSQHNSEYVDDDGDDDGDELVLSDYSD